MLIITRQNAKRNRLMSEIKTIISATENYKAKYDETIKELLSNELWMFGKVYSIWIYMGDVPNYEANTATLYYTDNKDIIGYVQRNSD